MQRRHALLFAAAATGARAWAQVPGGSAPRSITWLGQHRGEQVLIDRFVARMEALGWARGRDFTLETRLAGDATRMPALAAELVALHPSLMIGTGNQAIAALKAATTSIPIVMMGSAAPVGVGFVRSLARPGGNITGVTYHPVEIGAKMVEALKAAAPRASRITLVWNPDFPGLSFYKTHFDSSLARLKLESTYLDVRRPQDFTAAAVLAQRPDAVVVVLDPVTTVLFPAISRFAIEHKLPTISAHRAFTTEGGMLALTPDLEEFVQNGTELVVRVLRGANPGELPVREPSRFNLIANLKTARAIGLAIPREVLLQANEVME